MVYLVERLRSMFFVSQLVSARFVVSANDVIHTLSGPQYLTGKHPQEYLKKKQRE